LVVAIGTIFLAKHFEKGIELSYSIDEPTVVLNESLLGELPVIINDVSAKKVYLFKVRIWNSGEGPIKNIPIQLTFDNLGQGFTILNISHNTTPKYLFGKLDDSTIVDKPNGNLSLLFTYELLNSGDEDVITLLANGNATVDAFARGEGLKPIKIDPEKPKVLSSSNAKMLVIIFIVAIFLLIVIGTVMFKMYFFYRKLEKEKVLDAFWDHQDLIKQHEIAKKEIVNLKETISLLTQDKS